MFKLNSIFVSVLALCCLTGCKEKLTYSYLLRHPQELNQQLVSCQEKTDKTKEETLQCNMAVSAATQFSAIVDEAQQDPEKFGERVIKLEMDYAKAKATVHVAQKKVDELMAKHAPIVEIQAANKQLASANNTCHDMQQELRVLLAVIGLGSPE